MSRRASDWRYRAWREAELPLLVDEPAVVRTTELPVPEADPAVACVAETDDLIERLEPKLRRVIHACAVAGDQRGVTRALFTALRVLARAEPRERLFAPSARNRHTALAVLYLHDEATADAAPVSRGRFYQLVDITLMRWARARFPALAAWAWAEREAARRVVFRRENARYRRRIRRAPVPPPAAAPPPIPPWIVNAVPAWGVHAPPPDPDPADWLRLLASVRPVADA